MKKTVLSAKSTHTLEITQNVQSLSFKNISPKAKIKVVVDREGHDIITPIRTMTLGRLLEAEDKVQTLTKNRTVVRHLKNVAADGENKIDVIENATLTLCTDGEFPLGEDDKITVELSDLGLVNANSSVTEVVGSRIGSRLVNYGKVVFLPAHDEKSVDVMGVSALIIDPAKAPQTIELYYETETRVLDLEILKQLNEDEYGLVQMVTNDAGVSVPKFGFAEALLISMTGVRKCLLKDETSNDPINVYTVKF